uniref:t-SNARE coiled-coil homology domain-containing protein n=1 Tax=Cuerna arida TaxID=1464854 RepID=A0A1B6ERL7_9HEMI
MAISYLEMDKWSSKHASCEAQHRFIVELLNTRSYEPRTSNKYDLLSAKARYQLKEFEANIRILKEMLEEEQSLTIEEKERRYRLIEDLESYVIQLTQKINTRSGEEERKSLMATGGRSVLGDMGTTGWASDDDDDAVSQPLLQETNEQIRQQHQQLLQEQEDGLERLSRVISRQKDIAVTIGNEVDFQNELVDNIAERLDRTNVTIQRETAHVQVISRTDNTCGYWVVIMILFVAIILVGAL